MGEQQAAESLAWEVRLPGKRTASFGGPKPKGTLVIDGGSPDEESMTLPKTVATILSAKKKSGEVKVSSRAELRYVVGELARSCASSRIERLINQREYSCQELRTKLRQDGYASSTIDACLSRACEAGLVSDSRFADSFIRTKVSAGWGMQRIARELSRRGIEVGEVEGWPYDYLDPDDELNRALELARRRRVSGARPYEKLTRFLCSRGFSLGVATRAARTVLDERTDEEG